MTGTNSKPIDLRGRGGNRSTSLSLFIRLISEVKLIPQISCVQKFCMSGISYCNFHRQIPKNKQVISSLTIECVKMENWFAGLRSMKRY